MLNPTPRTVVVGKINVLLAALGLLFVAGTYWLIALLPEAFAVLLLVVPVLMVISRIWQRSPRTTRIRAPPAPAAT